MYYAVNQNLTHRQVTLCKKNVMTFPSYFWITDAFLLHCTQPTIAAVRKNNISLPTIAVERSCSHKLLQQGRAKTRTFGGTKFKFGQLILRKIIKIVAIRCHILRLKCTKFDFGSGCAPDRARDAHSAPQIPYSWI